MTRPLKNTWSLPFPSIGSIASSPCPRYKLGTPHTQVSPRERHFLDEGRKRMKVHNNALEHGVLIPPRSFSPILSVCLTVCPSVCKTLRQCLCVLSPPSTALRGDPRRGRSGCTSSGHSLPDLPCHAMCYPLGVASHLLCTEMIFDICRSCLAGPRQGQAEQLSKSRKKFHQTTFKE